MSAVIDYLVGPNYYDQRVKNWPLVDWKAALAISALYVGGVYGGKRLMKHRKPFNVKPFAVVHNAVMFSLSLYMVVETLTQSYVNFGWSLRNPKAWGNVVENPQSSQFSPSGYRLARVLWIHYLSKVYEFADTAIMVLKKNDRQISFLHVYHHASTFFPCWWAAINFAPGGDVYFICALNSFVHVLMYGYYLASSLNLRVPSIFKRSITKVQMIQFALLNAQALYGKYVASYYRPRIVVDMAIFQSIVFMTLFANFYRQAYKKSAAAAAAAAKKKAGGGGKGGGGAKKRA